MFRHLATLIIILLLFIPHTPRFATNTYKYSIFQKTNSRVVYNDANFQVMQLTRLKSSSSYKLNHKHSFPKIFVKANENIHVEVPKRLVVHRALKKWTFIVYLDADNDLEECGIDDFLEMSSIGSTDNVSIVVLFDRHYDYDTSYDNWNDTKLFYVTKSMTPNASNAVADWGERNMGNPQTIVDLVLWAFQNYPAEHYAVILWDHGGGLMGACIDDTDGDSLNLYEIREAFEAIYNATGRKIDIVGFDACLMGMMDVVYMLRDYVDYVVFSEEYEPGDGWPYDEILNALVSNPLMSPADLAKLIVQKYIESYNNGSQGYDEYATSSAVNITYFVTKSIPKLNRLIGEILRNYDTYSSAISSAVSDAETFYYSDQKDLIHFLELLKNKIFDSTLQNMITESINAINESILSAGHLEGHPNAHGLAAYFPDYYDETYNELDMSIDHQWDEFTRKRCNETVGLWFYDIWVNGSDVDKDGYYDHSVNITIDLDSDVKYNVTIRVYSMYEYQEVIVSEVCGIIIYGATNADVVSLPITQPMVKGNYNFRFEIFDEYGDLIKQFYYYCDEDVTGVPLENPPGNPIITVVSPTPGSIVNDVVVIKVNASDEDGISSVKIFTDAWYNMTYNSTSGLYEYNWDTTPFDDGNFLIRINATDTEGNTSTLLVLYTIDNIMINFVYPKSNAIIRRVINITVNITLRTTRGSIDTVYAQFVNDTFISSPIILGYDADLKAFKAMVNTCIFSDGFYYIKVVANTTAGGKEVAKIYVKIDNYIAPILLVDDDDGDYYEIYYISALEDLGYVRDKDFEVWSIEYNGSITYDILVGRQIVIWFTGSSAFETLTEHDQEVLAKYLDSGGSLFISGQDIGYDIGFTDFYKTYLRAVYIADNADSYEIFGVGYPFNGKNYLLYGSDSANDSYFPDAIEPAPNSGAWLILNYTTEYGAAIAYNISYKLIYFAFPFEAINGSDARAECMRIIIDFLKPTKGAPKVRIIYPSEGDKVSGVVNITINATNPNSLIVYVAVSIDIGEWFNATYDPHTGYYVYMWNTSKISDGEHIIIAKAVDNEGKTAYHDIRVVVDNYKAWILIVDDDEGEKYEKYYIEALEQLGLIQYVDFEVWEHIRYGEPSAETLKRYSVIVWFTGDDYETTLEKDDRDALREYLVSGGNLFISGQDIGYDANSSGWIDWYETYLKAIFEADSTGACIVNGVSGSIFDGIKLNLSDGDGADNNFFPSEISPTRGSVLAMYYDDDPKLGAAIVYDGDYKLVYFAFPFEAINNADDRAEVMRKILRFFGEYPVYVRIISPENNSYINSRMITISWTAEAKHGIDHFEVSIDNQDWINIGNKTEYTIELYEGTHIVSIKAVDIHGRIFIDTIVFHIDVTPPTINILNPINGSIIQPGNITIVFEAKDNIALAGVLIRIDEGNWTDLGVKKLYNYTVTLSEGKHVITIRAYDKAGNSRIANIIIEIKAKEAISYWIILIGVIISVVVIGLLIWRKRLR